MRKELEELEQGLVALPELSFDNLEALMKERMAACANEETTIPMLWQGLTELKIPVDGKNRTAKVYIPQNVPQGTMFVLLNVPEGEETFPFLLRSGWRKAADENKLCLFVAEPGESGWGSSHEEQAYLNACYAAEKSGAYFRGGLCMYAVGYGNTGALLHNVVIENPLSFAAAVFIGADQVRAGIFSAYRNQVFGGNGRTYNVRFGEIPVPVWMVSKKATPALGEATAYWRNAACAGTGVEDPLLGTVYCQERHSAFTPEGNTVKVAVKVSEYPYSDFQTTEDILRFLLQFSRAGGNGPTSNRITARVDYESLGVEFKRFTDRNGFAREYLVYVPTAFRDGSRPLPLVMALHGISESIRNYFESSLWYEKAEKENFILVMPEARLMKLPNDVSGGEAKAYRTSWSVMTSDEAYTDADYINEVLDRVSEEYPVDPGRVYCTGHSMGCMLTNYLGSGKTSSRFAALGATSGILAERDSSGTGPLPVFLTMGEYDLWSKEISADSVLTDALDLWLVRNRLASAETVRQVRTNGCTSEYVEGAFHHYIWENKEHIPAVRYAWVEKKEHMNTPEENNCLWDEWFSKWRMDETGVRWFEHKKLEAQEEM